jgi:hypothetical protein
MTIVHQLGKMIRYPKSRLVVRSPSRNKPYAPRLERLEERVCLSLALTQAGRDEGIGISIFAVDFPATGSNGPLGIAFPASGGVLVTDQPGDVRLFPNDSDGQSASWYPPAQNYGASNAFGLTQLGGNIYMTQRSVGQLVQLNDDGTLNQVILSGLAGPEGLAADPGAGRLFVATRGGIIEVDPIADTASRFVNARAHGLLLSADQQTLFAAQSNGHVVGYDTSTANVVFDSGFIAGTPRSIAEATSPLDGNLFVNMDNGTVVQINEATLSQTMIASGGSGGTFVTLDPNDGSFLFTQTDRIVRLSTPVAQGVNLIVNGDFERGNVGFTTDYQFVNVDTGPGAYGVLTNPGNFNNEFTSYGDHTSGAGLMMVVDGALVANRVVWSETVQVRPRTDYTFVTWVSTCLAISPAQLDFRFNDQSIGIFDAPGNSGIWESFSTTWNSGANTSVTIQIFDRNLQFSGNDFALDDISLMARGPAAAYGPAANAMAVFSGAPREQATSDSEPSVQRLVTAYLLDSLAAPVGETARWGRDAGPPSVNSSDAVAVRLSLGPIKPKNPLSAAEIDLFLDDRLVADAWA